MPDGEISADFWALLESGDYILFAGAGVGVEAGIPDWGESLRLLAQRLAPHAQSYAGLMFEEANKDRYLEAADLLYLAPISPTTRAELLQAVYGAAPTATRRLKQLVSARCQGIVTTNFDRSLDIAATAARVDLVRYTEHAEDLAHARVATAPYLLRLHGRIEVPETLALADRHFRALAQNEAYAEFFRSLFLNRNVIFFGYSFRDPILRTLIRAIGKAVHSVFRRRAFALMASPVSEDLRTSLRDVHVDVIEYSDANGHDAGWQMFTRAREAGAPTQPEIYETEALRSQLASVYTRAKARHFSADRARVLSGLMLPVLASLCADRETPVLVELFLTAVEEKLALPASLGRESLMEALRLLEHDGVISLVDESLHVRLLPNMDAFERDADRLLSGIVHRASVRTGSAVPKVLLPRVREAIVFVLTLDGLHVAHSLIRGTPLDRHRLRSVIDLALAHVASFDPPMKALLAEMIEQLMSRPDRDEERVLANISVVVFATAVLLGDPVLAQTAHRRLERGAYVDASVLLPWVCEGHPLHEPYANLMAAFGRGRVHVLSGYLNEMVSHRNLAKEAMGRALRNDADLVKYAGLFELHNINTFIAGFAAKRADGFAGNFNEYLATYTPFETDDAAARFLEKRGVVIERAQVRSSSSVYGELRAALKDLGKQRDVVVIEHDARQLEALARSDARDVVFITADRALISAASHTSLARVVGRMLLPQQAVYLSEFLSKGRGGFEGIVRAMWTQGDDVAVKVRRFYTDRILREYEFALVSEIPAVVAAMLAELEKSGVDLASEVIRGEGEGERLKVFAMLDRFEPRFYEQLAQAKMRVGIA